MLIIFFYSSQLQHKRKMPRFPSKLCIATIALHHVHRKKPFSNSMENHLPLVDRGDQAQFFGWRPQGHQYFCLTFTTPSRPPHELSHRSRV
jgi:hypothetical protein